MATRSLSVGFQSRLRLGANDSGLHLIDTDLRILARLHGRSPQAEVLNGVDEDVLAETGAVSRRAADIGPILARLRRVRQGTCQQFTSVTVPLSADRAGLTRCIGRAIGKLVLLAGVHCWMCATRCPGRRARAAAYGRLRRDRRRKECEERRDWQCDPHVVRRRRGGKTGRETEVEGAGPLQSVHALPGGYYYPQRSSGENPCRALWMVLRAHLLCDTKKRDKAARVGTRTRDDRPIEALRRPELC